MNFVNRIVEGYLIIVAFGLLAGYTFYHGRILEGVVYLLVTMGFMTMRMVRSGKFRKYKKTLNVISWVVIVAAVVLFIVLLRMDAYGW